MDGSFLECYKHHVYTNITQNNRWTTLPTMPTATSGSVISVDSDHIYVFGGYPDATQTQIYNKHTQQWSRGATMPAKCNMSIGRCIKEGNKFTIITTDTMMEYNSNDDTWKIVKQYKPYDGSEHQLCHTRVTFYHVEFTRRTRSHDMTLTVTMCGLKLTSMLVTYQMDVICLKFTFELSYDNYMYIKQLQHTLKCHNTSRLKIPH